MRDARQFYINGQWVTPAATNDFEVIDPSNEEAFAVISLGGKADTDAAVAAARAAFDGWSRTPLDERLGALEKLTDIYERRSDEMGAVISQEMGAPISMSKSAQAGAGSYHIRNLIRAARKFEFDRQLGDHAPNDRILYEPIGVCALITPWNWPMNQVTLKVIAAVTTGCTMVLKPSEIAPLSSMLFAEIVDESGLPAGVFNLVNGDGPGAGTQLSGHPDVDMISFTGSARAGTAISKNAADTIKRVSLELGGKGANIVFADADEKAVKRGASTASTTPANPAMRQPACLSSGRSTTVPLRLLPTAESTTSPRRKADTWARSCRKRSSTRCRT